MPRRMRAVRPRLALLVALASAAGLVVSLTVFVATQDKAAQPVVAGGYEAVRPSACLGASGDIELRQSGQFLSFSNARGTVGGEGRLEERPLAGDARGVSGTVECADGRKRQLVGRVTSGEGGTLRGSLDGHPLAAVLARHPPPPGMPVRRIPGAIDGAYVVSPRSACLGESVEFVRSGGAYRLGSSEGAGATLSYDPGSGVVAGTAHCVDGARVNVAAHAGDRRLDELRLTPLDPPRTSSRLPATGERVTAVAERESSGQFVAAFFVALIVVMLTARLLGTLLTRLGQPRVIGEVLAGLLLGPTLLGDLAPDLQSALFPSDILPALGIVANLGLVFFMFLVGLRIEFGQLRHALGRAAAISNASILLPLAIGVLIALPLYSLLAPDTPFAAFALFMGVAMSITAFPVLASILAERGMLERPIGAVVIACAAFDDLTAWCLIALATAAATSSSAIDAVRTAVLAGTCCLVLALVVRPLLARSSAAYERTGRLPEGWLVAIFAGLLGTAYVTEQIGIAIIFGAFAFGLAMPRNPGLRESLTGRVQDFVGVLLLPLFFVYTGLRTDVGLLDRPILWWITGLLVLVAIVGKLAGAAVAARLTGYDWRASTVIGTLMNTRGLTELIVLNLALETGVLSDALFASLVVMALVTTAMAGPLLRLLDPENRYGAPQPGSLQLEPTTAVPNRAVAA